MKKVRILAVVLASVVAWRAYAAFEITAAIQRELDRHVEKIRAWALDPAVVKAVTWGSQKGLEGMDNEKWKTVRRSDDVFRSYMRNDAAKILAKGLEGSNGLYMRAFLCGARGEQIATTEKTESYVFRGQRVFDVPFTTSGTFQGPPELDPDSDVHDLQISAPVLSNGKPIGVLVVGVNLTKLAKTIGP